MLNSNFHSNLHNIIVMEYIFLGEQCSKCWFIHLFLNNVCENITTWILAIDLSNDVTSGIEKMNGQMWAN